MLLIDLGLPDDDGQRLLRDLRDHGDTTPVLIITARDALNDKLTGLDTGADDYLVKPFDLDELSARIRAVLRRNTSASAHSAELEYGDLVLDTAALKLMHGRRHVLLGPKEIRIMQKLMEQAGRVVTKEILADNLYSWGHEVESNAIEVHIHRIRKKLDGGYIKTIRGMGYMLESEPDSDGMTATERTL